MATAPIKTSSSVHSAAMPDAWNSGNTPSHLSTATPVAYFDYQATTPIDPRVLDRMLPFMTTFYGNPHSRSHRFGWEAEAGLNNARAQLAKLINADPEEIIFTSGATEADNLAITGVANYHDNKLHIITSQIEHKAVLETCRALEDRGVAVTYLPVGPDGRVSLSAVEAAIRPDTKLVSIAAANNEIGAVAPLEQLGALCARHGILLHTDAAQATGRLPIDVRKQNIALLSVSGHKMYGPKGIGALYVRRKPRARLLPLQHGGGQERGLRSGTTPSFLAVGLGAAAEVAQAEMSRDTARIRKLSKRFYNTLVRELGEGVILNGAMPAGGGAASSGTASQALPEPAPADAIDRLMPGCLNISFAYVEGESLLMKLKDFALSSGSACTSASLEPSYVLRALGASEDLAHSSIRFGIGRYTTEADVDRLAAATVKAVKELRELSPLYEMAKSGIDLSTIKWTA